MCDPTTAANQPRTQPLRALHRRNLSHNSNATTSTIFQAVLADDVVHYLGKTVQVIPHITDEIKRASSVSPAPMSTSSIAEVSGTVGDVEILPFLEAILSSGTGRA